MITIPLSEWVEGIRQNTKYSSWVVTSIRHMKNFQYSAVFHEFLQVTIKLEDTSEEPYTLIFEREEKQDQVTLGWQPVEYQLTKWWIRKLLKGHYSETTKSSIIDDSTRRAIGYSGSDFLCSLDFHPGFRLKAFAQYANDISRRLESYHPTKRNCYKFAGNLYDETMQAANLQCKETKGIYYHHKAKFATLTILGHPGVSVLYNRVWKDNLPIIVHLLCITIYSLFFKLLYNSLSANLLVMI